MSVESAIEETLEEVRASKYETKRLLDVFKTLSDRCIHRAPKGYSKSTIRCAHKNSAIYWVCGSAFHLCIPSVCPLDIKPKE